MERGIDQSSALARRTAAFLLRFVVGGLQRKLFFMGSGGGSGVGGGGLGLGLGVVGGGGIRGIGGLNGQNQGQSQSELPLHTIYKSLKVAVDSETDAVARFHCENALLEISSLVSALYAYVD